MTASAGLVRRSASACTERGAIRAEAGTSSITAMVAWAAAAAVVV
jgi:hypothetical protein